MGMIGPDGTYEILDIEPGTYILEIPKIPKDPHTAGFTHDAPIGNLADTRYGSFEEHVLSIQQTWLKFRVGERYSSSNLGIKKTGAAGGVRAWPVLHTQRRGPGLPRSTPHLA